MKRLSLRLLSISALSRWQILSCLHEQADDDEPAETFTALALTQIDRDKADKSINTVTYGRYKRFIKSVLGIIFSGEHEYAVTEVE